MQPKSFLALSRSVRRDSPRDRQGRERYLDDFAELATKVERPQHPPGRDLRYIVSVAMLTEGWDCNTVTHIVGLPRSCRSCCANKSRNRLACCTKVFGGPFEIIPMKANPHRPPPQRRPAHALPNKSEFEIRFPRVEGYTQAVFKRLAVDWSQVPPLHLLPGSIPPEVGMNVAVSTLKGLHNSGISSSSTL